MIQNIIDQVKDAASQGFEVTPTVVLLENLGIGFVLSLAMRWHFRIFGSTFSNRREFGRNFTLILLTTILLITVVKSSIALSLGLVGALSIVRFRTPIKEPEELAYLFLAIGIGVGLGALQTELVLYASVAILVAMALVQWSNRAHRGKSLYLSIEWLCPVDQQKPLDELTRIIGSHADSSDLRRVDTRDRCLDATFYLDLDNMNQLSDMLAQLQLECPGVNVTVIDQNRMPAI